MQKTGSVAERKKSPGHRPKVGRSEAKKSPKWSEAKLGGSMRVDKATPKFRFASLGALLRGVPLHLRLFYAEYRSTCGSLTQREVKLTELKHD